jgi:hypothetical protein
MKKPKRGKKHDAILETLEGLQSVDGKSNTIELLKEDIALNMPYSDVVKKDPMQKNMSLVKFKHEDEIQMIIH